MGLGVFLEIHHVAMSRQVRPGAFIMMKCGLVAGGAGSNVADGSEGHIYREGIPEEVVTKVSIEEVYQTEVLIKKNPLSGKPYVILVSKT